jgi:hypothetical protein
VKFIFWIIMCAQFYSGTVCANLWVEWKFHVLCVRGINL